MLTRSSADDRPITQGPFLLTQVEQTFTITGRGLVVVPAFPKGGPPFVVKVGDLIELRPSSASIVRTTIAEFCHMTLVGGGSQWALRLPPEINETDVPVGTEIWWMAPQKGPE